MRKSGQGRKEKAQQPPTRAPRSNPPTTAATSHTEKGQQLSGCIKHSIPEVQLASFAKDLTDAEMEQLTKDWPIGEEVEDLHDYSGVELHYVVASGKTMFYTIVFPLGPPLTAIPYLNTHKGRQVFPHGPRLR